MPAAWEADLSDEYEWIPLRLPPDVTRLTASVMDLKVVPSATNGASPSSLMGRL